MDIYGYFKRENAKLFDRLETVAESDDPALHSLLLNDLNRDLPAYLDAKARSLYRALKDYAAAEPHLIAFKAHAARIHHALEAVFAAREDGPWQGQFTALRNAVLSHLDDEEHDVFPAARRWIHGRTARQLRREAETTLRELEAA